MTHASLELAWMMVGFAINDATTFTAKFCEHAAEHVVCGAKTEDEERIYGWFGDWTAQRVFKEHRHEVTCPGCLVGIDAALEGRIAYVLPGAPMVLK